MAVLIADRQRDDNEVQWRFGPGLFSYRMARADIAGVSIVRNSVLNGFGIRMRPGFRSTTSRVLTPWNCA